jgi:hypothetical protein
MFAFLESTSLATAIKTSVPLTASLSAVHALGFALVMGSAILLNLRYLGLLFRDRPLGDVVAPAAAGLIVGVTINVVTGFLMFMPRAVAAADNRIFRLKLVLLVAAIGFACAQIAGRGRVPLTPAAARVRGALGLALWVGLALSACAFILFESAI